MKTSILLLACLAVGCGKSGDGKAKDGKRPERKTVHEEMTMRTYVATAPKGKYSFNVKGQISDYFNYGYEKCKQTHYAINLSPAAGQHVPMTCYVLRDSALGRRIYAKMKDGEGHWLVVTVSRSGPEASCVDLIDADW